ncbi:dermonecrotic toxin domain-containing protein [Arsenophonus nasoniae]|uniref:Dermonecrotic toxin N-terminal domain-containing protein n=1 Tax=Arsenophonus nasoniae TaxID=638 RepID=A0AA95GZD4_9GAMM|nr:DUF6543 domain-containing protein [Arsenophonus nasoniae]WGM03595.1 hypothetical protein QE210_18995 [Arsenophonus nasoniae]
MIKFNNSINDVSASQANAVINDRYSYEKKSEFNQSTDEKESYKTTRRTRSAISLSGNHIRNGFIDTFKAAKLQELREYKDLKQKVISEQPNVLNIAKKLLHDGIYNKLGKDIDPDKIYIHRFNSAESLGNGWEHNELPVESYTLTKFMLKNFNAHEQEKFGPELNLDYGIYNKGPRKNFYGKKDEVGISASDLRDIIWEIDFNSKFKSALKDFWEKNERNVSIIHRINFCIEAKIANLKGAISQEDFDLVMDTAAPGVAKRGDVTLQFLQKSEKSGSLAKVGFLDINGYPSSDILYFTAPKGKKILYIPNSTEPFYSFYNDEEMRTWLVKQFANNSQKLILEEHFSLYNRQDGLPIIGYTGVSNGMTKLGNGSWDRLGSGINNKSNIINEDVFVRVTREMKTRMFSDTDILIKSNNEVRKDIALEYLQATNQILGPLLLVLGPIGGTIGATGFLAQVGLETYTAFTGDSEKERSSAALSAGMDIGFALLLGLIGIKKLKTSEKNVLMYSEEFNASHNKLKSDLTMQERLYNIKTEGMSGRGASVVSRIWGDQDLVIAEWKKWTENCAEEYRENRKIAFNHIREYFENRNNFLNLQNLALTTLPDKLPSSLEILNIGNNELTRLPDNLPDSLRGISVSNNHLIHLPDNLPSHLEHLYASNNQLVNLPDKLPDCLQTLSVMNNQLRELPDNLPSSLEKLLLNNNELIDLRSKFPNSLKSLHVSDNQLSNLPDNLPDSITRLDVWNNRLTSLPSKLPCSLKELHLINNLIENLPADLPNSLTVLTVDNNLLTDLPKNLPISLKDFSANNNRLRNLTGNMPSFLEKLEVQGNQLTGLPNNLPNSLKFLVANNNNLEVLPRSIPSYLEELYIANNRISNLPDNLPDCLRILNVRNNQLIHLPEYLLHRQILGNLEFLIENNNIRATAA